MDPLEEVKRLLLACSEQGRREILSILRKEFPIHGLEADWNVTAEVVLEAINRASDMTQRMFRGVLAEAACKVEVIDKLGRWLIPRPENARLIAVYQPVSFATNDDWTDSLATCIEWLDSGVNKTIAGANYSSPHSG